MRYLGRLLRVFFVTGLLTELQYRANFSMQLVQALMSLGTSVAGLAIIFSNTRTLGGWTPAQMVALLGMFYLMASFIHVFLKPAMQRLMQDVRQGTLDYMLIKPVDSQLLASFREMVVLNLTDTVMGLALLIGATVKLGTTVGAGNALVFAVALVSGAVIVYSVWIMLATLTFWVVRADNILVIFTDLYEAGRYPITIYPGWLRVTLTFLVPVAFATTVPAQALSSHLTPAGLLGAVALAVCLLVASRLFWRFGLRHYTGASA